MTMSLLDQKSRGFQAVMVGMANQEVHMYQDKNLVDIICTQVTTPPGKASARVNAGLMGIIPALGGGCTLMD